MSSCVEPGGDGKRSARCAGLWPGDTWAVWWSDTPVYHVPLFVLSLHPRTKLEMAGGKTFHFVADGIYAALGARPPRRRGQDGGVSRHHPVLSAGLVDEMHLALTRLLLGQGDPCSRRSTCRRSVSNSREACRAHPTDVVLAQQEAVAGLRPGRQ